MLIIASANPNFNIAIEPENPINERSNGLQNGQVVLKKLMKAPIKPTFADFKDFCLFLIANTCNEIRRPPKRENKTTNEMLTLVKE